MAESVTPAPSGEVTTNIAAAVGASGFRTLVTGIGLAVGAVQAY